MNKQNVILDFEDFLNSYKNQRCADSNAKNILPLHSESPLLEEYAYLIGKVTGDGNLDPSFTLRFIGKIKDLRLLRYLIINKFMIKPSKLSIREKVAKGSSFVLQINCAYLGRILSLLGAPIGNKTKTVFHIPNWILTNKDTKKRFLQALLEDELTTIKIEKCNYCC